MALVVVAVLLFGIGGYPGQIPAYEDAGRSQVGVEFRREHREVFPPPFPVGKLFGAEGGIGYEVSAAQVPLENEDIARRKAIGNDIEGEGFPSQPVFDAAPECCLLNEPGGHELGDRLGKDKDVHGASPEIIVGRS